jgi:hypothetical protein
MHQDTVKNSTAIFASSTSAAWASQVAILGWLLVAVLSVFDFLLYSKQRCSHAIQVTAIYNGGPPGIIYEL